MLENIKADVIPRNMHAFFKNKLVKGNKYSETLDFCFSKNQNKKITIQNRKLAADHLKCNPNKIFFLNQNHSSRVLFIKDTFTKLIEPADGMVTNIEGVGLAILTADCAPVLLFDSIAKVIGAAHAGWRGALNGILENTVDAMLRIGATNKNIKAAIGPCISKNNYEVKEDLKARVIHNDKVNDKYFHQRTKDTYLFDLSGFIVGRLNEHGVKTTSRVNMCTYNKNNNFHSYRRAEHVGYPNYKRNLSLIKL